MLQRTLQDDVMGSVLEAWKTGGKLIGSLQWAGCYHTVAVCHKKLEGLVPLLASQPPQSGHQGKQLRGAGLKPEGLLCARGPEQV